MQELEIQPTNPTPYTPAGGVYNNNPVPGAGGLPALSGLTRNVNPMAQQLQSQGRGEDSVLVHMTPDEVNSLRGLAQKFGGDLSVNPNTGLPEAGWLGKLLPTILGIAGAAVGIPTWAIGAGVGVGGTAITGDLNKGLMAGLQAFGGATMASSLGVGQAPVGITPTPAPTDALNVGSVGGTITPQLSVPADIAAMGTTAAPAATPTLASTALQGAPSIASQAPTTLLAPGVGAPATPGFLDKFSTAAREGMKAGTLPYKVAPYAAGLGTLSAVSDVTAPKLPEYQPEEDKWDYKGPYLPMPRRVRPTVTGSGEISFFEDSNPYPGYLPAGYAEGGTAEKFDYNKALQTFNAAATELNTGTPGGLTSLGVPLKAFQDQQTALRELQLNNASTQAQHDAALKSAMAFLDQYRPKAAVDTTKVTETVTPTRATETVRATETAPRQSGFGVQALGETYTPRFTPRADYVTPRATPYTMGSQLAAQMPQFVSQFQTSPGAITASRTYPGGSASERIRAIAQANAANPMSEVNFGFKTPVGTDNPYAPGGYMNNFSADLINKYLADYGYGARADTTAGSAGSNVKEPSTSNIFVAENPRTTPPGDMPPVSVPPIYTPPASVPPIYTPPASVPPIYTPPMDTTVPPAAPVAPPAIFTPGYDYTNIPSTDYAALNEYMAQLAPYSNARDISGPVREYAKGGIHMDDGAFVIDARTVSELGNGSSSAGQELLARLGGRPVKGPGDGVSDSIPANIGGTQEARVARDEVIIPADAVRKIGGAKKLYALMDKAHKARKKAKRGEDTKVAKGLGALA